MIGEAEHHLAQTPGAWGAARLVPLGDCHLLVRFADNLSEAANSAAIAFSKRLSNVQPNGVLEVSPNLVSVLVRYDPLVLDQDRLAGEIGLLLSANAKDAGAAPARHHIAVSFGGIDGPDLDSVAELLDLSAEAFISAHNERALRALATGFAPGFVYCGFHPPELRVARRTEIRSSVPVGSILFAAGQTAIAATELPTGWHVIGRTDFRNFDAKRVPPTRITAGDAVTFRIAT